MGYAIPAYKHTHRGPVIVLGSADCALRDLSRAQIRFCDAPIIGVNDASKISALDHLFSLHAEFLEQWAREQAERFGRQPLVHSAARKRADDDASARRIVDYWWAGAHSGATSAWSAVRVAKMMGFERVIMCGCPLRATGYATDPRQDKHSRSLGLVADDHPMIKRFRKRLAEYVGEGEGEGVFSMSGFTRELLGAP